MIGGLGVLVGLYGAWLLLSRQDLGQIVEVAIWFAAGVLAHDVVIALLILGVGALMMRNVPLVLRAPLAVGSIVLASVTLLAVPMLGRFGAKADNPTLLDRNYLVGYAVLVLLIAVGVAVATVVGMRHGELEEGTGSGASPRR